MLTGVGCYDTIHGQHYVGKTKIKETFMEKLHDLKFFAKPPKGKMKGLLIVFAWIILWNFIYQAVHGAWHDMPIANWAFFISVTIFFMQEELTYKARFWHTLIGGAVGLLLAAGLVTVDVLLVKSGVPHLAAVMIPLTVCIAALILLNPYLPVFFNNVGFCYFIISLINAKAAVEKLPVYLLSLLLGSIFLNLGCSGLLALYKKAMMKKAAAKSRDEK